jgi:hypothetical protein
MLKHVGKAKAKAKAKGSKKANAEPDVDGESVDADRANGSKRTGPEPPAKRSRISLNFELLNLNLIKSDLILCYRKRHPTVSQT